MIAQIVLDTKLFIPREEAMALNFNENERVALFRASNGKFISYETTRKQSKTTVKAFGCTFSKKTGNEIARRGISMYKIVKVTEELELHIELSELAKKHINYNCDFSFDELVELGKCIKKNTRK